MVLFPNRLISGIRVAAFLNPLVQENFIHLLDSSLCKSYVTSLIEGSMSSRFPSFTWISCDEYWMAVCNAEQPRSENLVLKIPCELQFAPKVYEIGPIAIRGGVLIQPISQQIKSGIFFQFLDILQRSSVRCRENVKAIPKEQCS